MPRKITAEMLRKMLIKLPQNRGKNVFQTFRGKKEHITCKKNELAKDFYFLLSSNTLMSGKKKGKRVYRVMYLRYSRKSAPSISDTMKLVCL